MPSYDVLSTIHVGTYEDLAMAYQNIVKFAKREDIKLSGACYETYLRSRESKVEDKDLVTQVIFEVID